MEPETREQEPKVFCANCEHRLTPTCIKCHKHDGFQPGDEWLCQDCCGEFYDPCQHSRDVLSDLEEDGRLDALRLVTPLPGNEGFAAMIYEFDGGNVKYAQVSWCIEDVMGHRACSWDEAKAFLKEHAASIADTMIEAGYHAISDL